jgi:hypothetical protein
LGGCVAQCCAFDIELDTSGHHIAFFFLQAKGGALLTFGGAAETSFDAGLVQALGLHIHFR